MSIYRTWGGIAILAAILIVIGVALGLAYNSGERTPVLVLPPSPVKQGQAVAIGTAAHRTLRPAPPRFFTPRYETVTFDTSAATNCIQRSVSCRPAYLQRINAARAQVGAPPLKLDLIMSRGVNGGCPGSAGHSRAMADTGSIWHTSPDAQHAYAQFNQDVCVTGPVSTEGENVGMAGGYGKWDGIVTIDDMFMAEPWTPGCKGNHHCNLLYAGYTRVGVGIVQQANAVWLTLDFEG